MRMILACGALTVLAGCFEKAPQGHSLPDCPGGVFDRQARVFGVLTLCATEGVSADKLTHAANVAAEWLDNNGDGRADEPRVIAAMEQTQPFLIMTPKGPGRAVMRAVEPALRSRVGQDLGANETNPAEGRDAAQEEIHHLVLNAGWKQAFPDLFMDAPGSVLYGQWEQAEAQGNYAYNDPTCDAACKVTEFFYLATAAYLGSADDLASDEMRLKTRAALSESLPGTAALIENPAYAYPRFHWPGGTYTHQDNIIITP